MPNMSTDKDKINIRFSPIIIGTMRLGAWGSNFSTDELERFVDACVELGLHDFDHADIYGHYTEEERFGRLMRRRPDLKVKVRITTKCGIRMLAPNRPAHTIKSYDSTAKHLIWSAEHSLQQLGVEVLDLFLIHRPDYLMDPHEVAEAVERLKSQGKIKAFGVSNFSPSQFELLHSFTPLSTNQVEISLLHRHAFEDGTLDQCLRLGITPTAWSPYGGGSIFTGNTPEILRMRTALQEVGETHNASIDQVLLAFLVQHPAGIVPIVGSSKIARIQAAKQALDNKLSHEEWYRLWKAATGQEVV